MIRSLLTPLAARVMASGRLTEMQQLPGRLRQRFSSRTPELLFFHAFEDPYSYLALEVSAELQKRYDVAITIVIVPDANVATHLQDSWLRYRRHDAQRLARAWRMDALLKIDQPAPDAISACIRRMPGLPQAKRNDGILQMSRAIWNADPNALSEWHSQLSESSDEVALAGIRNGADKLEEKGHYQAGTWHFGGRWYVGLDRLQFLEHDLRRRGLQQSDTSVNGEVFTPRLIPNLHGDRLDFYFSFRSPYSYLAMERLLDMIKHSSVTLRMRPLLPMVERGVELSVSKRNYILSDAGRIARHQGIPFGKMFDPLGKGIDNCIALFYYARELDREQLLVSRLMRAIWAEGENVANDKVLARLVTEAGINWQDAKRQMPTVSAMEQVERNRQQMEMLGLWGVPTFALTDMQNNLKDVFWGQDRLTWLEYGLPGLKQ